LSSSVETVPAQDCVGNCKNAMATCCGGPDYGKCRVDQTLYGKCKNQFFGCLDKCVGAFMADLAGRRSVLFPNIQREAGKI
jgi:hypothetical protein